MSVHYSAILSKTLLSLPGFDEFVLPTGAFAYVANSPAEAVACLDRFRILPNDLCVLVYDDRVGLRESIVISDGARVTFGAGDELWVPLGEDGHPLATARALRHTELQDDEEYATIKDAIQLGLDRFGASMSSRKFQQLVVASSHRA